MGYQTVESCTTALSSFHGRRNWLDFLPRFPQGIPPFKEKSLAQRAVLQPAELS